MSVNIVIGLTSSNKPEVKDIICRDPRSSCASYTCMPPKRSVKPPIQPKKQMPVVEKEFQYQVPLISQAIRDVLATLKDVHTMATKMTKAQNQELTSVIEKTTPTGIYPGLTIQQINEQVGKGVFLAKNAKPIEPLQILGIYSGEYVVKRLDETSHNELNYAFNISGIIALEKAEYKGIFGTDDNFVENGDYVVYTDGKKMGNWTRFMNHGGKLANCIPNIGLYTYMKDGVQHRDYVIVISAKKQINPGEQLLLNYGDEYWETESEGEELNPQTYTV